MMLEHVQKTKNKYGREYHYYRRGKFRQSIKGVPGTPEFLENYTKIHATFEREATKPPAPNTFDAMVNVYYASPEFTQRRDTTKDEYRRHIDDARGLWGDLPLSGVTKASVIAWRNTRQDRPTTANKGVETIRTLFNFAIDNEIFDYNPALKVKPLKVPDSDGWSPWPHDALIDFAEKSQGISRIAFFLALFTGQRRADVLTMRWDDIEDNGVHVCQEKTNQKVWVPIHPRLATELAIVKREQLKTRERRMEKGQTSVIGLTIVQKLTGEAYTDDGFGTLWNREQHRLKIKWPFHGLRKNATIALLEAGASVKVVQSITGHATMEMVELYGRKVNQKKLALEGMKLLADSNLLERTGN